MLACEGCDWTTNAETVSELYEDMMKHGEGRHANLFEGKTSEELEAMKKMMRAHIYRMIAAQN